MIIFNIMVIKTDYIFASRFGETGIKITENYLGLGVRPSSSN